MCGRSYRVKDDLGGRSIRCKSCGEPVEIPHAEGDDYHDDDYGDGYDGDYGADDYGGYDDDDDPYRPSRRSSSGRRSSGGRSRRASRSSPSGMPGAVIGVVVIEGIFIALNIFNVISSLMTMNIPSAIGGGVRLLIELGLIVGYFTRSSAVRILSIILSGCGMLFAISCIGMMVFAKQQFANRIPGAAVGLVIGLLVAQIILWIASIVLLMLEDSQDYFDR